MLVALTAELLRRWRRCLEARVAAPPPAFSASARQPASSRSSSSAQGPVPRRCCRMMAEGYSTSSWCFMMVNEMID